MLRERERERRLDLDVEGHVVLALDEASSQAPRISPLIPHFYQSIILCSSYMDTDASVYRHLEVSG